LLRIVRERNSASGADRTPVRDLLQDTPQDPRAVADRLAQFTFNLRHGGHRVLDHLRDNGSHQTLIIVAAQAVDYRPRRSADPQDTVGPRAGIESDRPDDSDARL